MSPFHMLLIFVTFIKKFKQFYDIDILNQETKRVKNNMDIRTTQATMSKLLEIKNPAFQESLHFYL